MFDLGLRHHYRVDRDNRSPGTVRVYSRGDMLAIDTLTSPPRDGFDRRRKVLGVGTAQGKRASRVALP